MEAEEVMEEDKREVGEGESGRRWEQIMESLLRDSIHAKLVALTRIASVAIKYLCRENWRGLKGLEVQRQKDFDRTRQVSWDCFDRRRLQRRRWLCLSTFFDFVRDLSTVWFWGYYFVPLDPPCLITLVVHRCLQQWVLV